MIAFGACPAALRGIPAKTKIEDSFFKADPKLFPIAIGTDNDPIVFNLFIGLEDYL